jgi:hypothetical protein
MNMSNENQTEDVDDPIVDDAAPVAAPANPNNLTVHDLNTMATVIEAVSQRGAVRAGEMQVVGQLYTKLHAFLVATGIRQAPGVTAGPVEAVSEEASEEVQEESTDA